MTASGPFSKRGSTVAAVVFFATAFFAPGRRDVAAVDSVLLALGRDTALAAGASGVGRSAGTFGGGTYPPSPTATRSSRTSCSEGSVPEIGKTDITALVSWKRLSAQTRSVTDFMSVPDTHVRAVTERAVTAVRDTTLTRSEAARTGRGIIAELPGFRTGDRLASAVLTAAAPQRMAVYDRRVQHALHTLGLPPLTPAPGRYGRYLQLLDDLLDHGAARADGWSGPRHRHRPDWTGGPPPAHTGVGPTHTSPERASL